jgi:hypothetical protein
VNQSSLVFSTFKNRAGRHRFGFSLLPHPADRPPLAGSARQESSCEPVTKPADRHSARPNPDEMPTFEE